MPILTAASDSSGFVMPLVAGSLELAIVAPEARFEQVVQAARPVLASIEFHTRSRR
jgi:hypothetical protein